MRNIRDDVSTKVTKPGYFSREHKTKKIHVSKLQLGMYVSKLDRDWLETPFLMQGFIIENLDDIDTLAELCTFVWIDAVFEEWKNPVERAVGKDKPKYTVRYINQISAQDEHREAVGVYKEARRTTKTLLDEVRLGGAINTKQAKSTVNDCVMSVLRNSDALLWMSRVRNEDAFTAEHCLNVCILAIAFGRHLGMKEEELQSIGMCGLLHDIGKMRVPNDILMKTGALTPKELKIYRSHTIAGRNLLMASHGIYHGAIDVAYSHHERLDGKGYPRGLKSAGISEYARMIAIVDAYDDLTVNRRPERSLTCTAALKKIYQGRGTLFDDKLALAFIKTVGLYPPGSIVELVNGLVGIVLETNHRYHHLPKILIVRDEDKQRCKEKIINLSGIQQGKLSKNNLIQRVHKDGTFGVKILEYREKGLTLH